MISPESKQIQGLFLIHDTGGYFGLTYQVALIAGGGVEPMHHDPHKTGVTGYYYHYHINEHVNDAHIWYLF